MHNPLDETTRAWGMACHLSALGGFIIPFGSVLIPLIIWLTQKEKHPFIDEQGKESVNFQISLIIYLLSFCLILVLLIVLIPFILGLLSEDYSLSFLYLFIPLQILPVFVVMAVMLFQLIMAIIAGVRAYNGQSYRYPFNLRLLK
ncbi:orotate phosphoribosyltransferase [Fischerella major NIES-592]|uniref:Orotate phosphoribosyltransferase n=3 Tax=Fischerella TaxID=1190 RepID=A0A1U7GZ20_9CYAN|nr:MULTISPECIES: DUF4870 domain-containing protein [Fischerella]BCX09231.1 MAG: hypothetical protein KatS3mg066_3090 [Fischerella sp.]OKH13659.1 orotate phosphoribosyltransferase [Fischerella major NIES-592]PLZ88740.1 DUF4870 domain-containing protein [Fischerella muscicola CCMEE 5323]PMB42910.1 DUF4870 domain-containing protein [Fischerella thermalis CCMEE 5330]BAU06915.1 hypothetical protein FIS3754_28380 [Fischerella sp. NIES-3754]